MTTNGKICMVTGATAGIGLVTAEALARTGATVVVVSRKPERCAATAEHIRASTGNPAVEYLAADLSSQASIRGLVHEFRNRHPRLDVLVNNAGAVFFKRQESLDRIEMTLALNHLGYFLLTALLLETLESSAPARVVNVSSDAHRMVKGFDFNDPEGVQTYGALRAYAQSKLANILFTSELARRVEGRGVTVNALHPGLVATHFGVGNGNGWPGRVMRWLSNLISISPAKGAQTSIYLATSPEVERISGQYFVKKKAVTPTPGARDAQAAQRLWELSASLTGLSK